MRSKVEVVGNVFFFGGFYQFGGIQTVTSHVTLTAEFAVFAATRIPILPGLANWQGLSGLPKLWNRLLLNSYLPKDFRS